MRGIITQDEPTEEQLEAMKAYTCAMPVDTVTCEKKYAYSGWEYKVAVLDFGLKQNIVRSLEKRSCSVTVFPARTSAEEILCGRL